MVITHVNCATKNSNFQNSQISNLRQRLYASVKAKARAENFEVLYKSKYSKVVPKLQEKIKTKDSEIGRMKKMLGKNLMRINNQSASLNALQKRHQESLQKYALLLYRPNLRHPSGCQKSMRFSMPRLSA